MTEALERAIAKLPSLPPADQDRLAELIEEAYEQLEWRELVESPESLRLLERLGKQALEEYQAENTSSMQRM